MSGCESAFKTKKVKSVSVSVDVVVLVWLASAASTSSLQVGVCAASLPLIEAAEDAVLLL